jgi:hypothetical protein
MANSHLERGIFHREIFAAINSVSNRKLAKTTWKETASAPKLNAIAALEEAGLVVRNARVGRRIFFLAFPLGAMNGLVSLICKAEIAAITIDFASPHPAPIAGIAFARLIRSRNGAAE